MGVGPAFTPTEWLDGGVNPSTLVEGVFGLPLAPQVLVEEAPYMSSTQCWEDAYDILSTLVNMKEEALEGEVQ